MGYIYKITNDINDKIYIGKTLNTIEKRFKKHCQDSKRKRYEKRPLYDAMNKYGIEHFHVEKVEEVIDPNKLSEREIYWIKYYDSYHNGYNATLGGDGKAYIDYNKIKILWDEGKLIKEIAQITNHDTDAISNILKNTYNIPQEAIIKRRVLKNSEAIEMWTKDGKHLRDFDSCMDAIRYIAPEAIKKSRGAVTHISDVCKGKRKTAYGYVWKYKK